MPFAKPRFEVGPVGELVLANPRLLEPEELLSTRRVVDLPLIEKDIDFDRVGWWLRDPGWSLTLRL